MTSRSRAKAGFEPRPADLQVNAGPLGQPRGVDKRRTDRLEGGGGGGGARSFLSCSAIAAVAIFSELFFMLLLPFAILFLGPGSRRVGKLCSYRHEYKREYLKNVCSC